MKKTESRAPAMGNTVSGPAKDIDEYLAGVPEPARSTLREMRATIRSVAPPEATEALGYGIPTFRYKGALVAFAAFTKHCSFFPMSLAVIAKLKKELKPYQASKGTLHFPLDMPLSASLVKKIVKARLAEKERKAR
jgi:uncharacterized protein YdhG (YjbR/CyaY superfamily)